MECEQRSGKGGMERVRFLNCGMLRMLKMVLTVVSTKNVLIG
jgi:hypothetical protein